MSYRNEREINYSMIAVIVFIAAIVIDFIMLQVIGPVSIINRWLWLPLVSGALALAVGLTVSNICESDSVKNVLGYVALFWGIIRAIIVIIMVISATADFGGVVSVIFHAPMILVLNAGPFFGAGGVLLEGFSTSSEHPKQNYNQPTRPLVKNVAPSTQFKQGNLTNYFRSDFCAPQSGSMYFWYSYPSMESLFGSHSNYSITGTIGIKKQSIEAFHVSSTDLSHYLDSVEREIKSYLSEITAKYRRDYPNDHIDFHFDINLKINVLD